MESIEAWEADQCVDFAVALARSTGWLLHVDWWSASSEHREDMPVEELHPLRVYVGDHAHRIFDVRGVKTLVEFSDRVIWPLVKLRSGNGGVYTRFYGEDQLAELPLHAQPDEAKIVRASEAIAANPHFLCAIPKRAWPCLPAHKAAWFMFGRCAAYAEVLHELTGLPAAGLVATRFAPLYAQVKRSADGYVHSVVIHPDGMAEDSWGKAPLGEIAERFGVIEFTVSTEAHGAAVAAIRSQVDAHFAAAMEEARTLIHLHRH